ncbi:unnamed protein product [Bursaphelenchus okinawaensis]|uniref:Uncharacterized protein n=1 Tax=Bursaphelenchus okinawaensis TaxID=465554 RepID=A0A811L695_9BILA|nr:unnamed protein product [Bursaphelenchus okinawaensis]CAG9118343.1 unnamed protein product [Bursaphelenchus okinawaensis]
MNGRLRGFMERVRSTMLLMARWTKGCFCRPGEKKFLIYYNIRQRPQANSAGHSAPDVTKHGYQRQQHSNIRWNQPVICKGIKKKHNLS